MGTIDFVLGSQIKDSLDPQIVSDDFSIIQSCIICKGSVSFLSIVSESTNLDGQNDRIGLLEFA